MPPLNNFYTPARGAQHNGLNNDLTLNIREQLIKTQIFAAIALAAIGFVRVASAAEQAADTFTWSGTVPGHPASNALVINETAAADFLALRTDLTQEKQAECATQSAVMVCIYQPPFTY